MICQPRGHRNFLGLFQHFLCMCFLVCCLSGVSFLRHPATLYLLIIPSPKLGLPGSRGELKCQIWPFPILLPEGPVTGNADREPNAEGSCRWCCGEAVCGWYLLLIIDAQSQPNHRTPGRESRPQPSPMWACVQVP